jgi:FMN phosphatase YigB (HAD superfamily)
MSISHILFDVYGTLVESPRMIPCYAAALGRVMSERYGGSAAAWERDSYYADLNLEDEDGVEQMWEGQLRTTRALFRLTQTPEPSKTELAALSRELPELASSPCDVLFPEVRAVLETLKQCGYVLGIASHAVSSQSRGALRGGGVLEWFAGPILGPDVTGRFQKDAAFYRSAGLPAASCLVVDDQPDGINGARDAGMKTAHVARNGQPTLAGVDYALGTDLRALLDCL